MAGWFGQHFSSSDDGSPRRRRALWLTLLVVIALVPAGAVVWNNARSGNGRHGEVNGGGVGTKEEDANASTSCGSGGTWDVKIGADSQASQINQTPVTSTVSALTSLNPSQNHRVNPVEFTMYKVTATLTSVYQEHDLDQHMSITDGSNHMLAELPDTGCDSGSIFASQIANAHAQLAAWSGHSQTVELTGVGFFDGVTGQSDQAPNQIELHPVININFNPGGPAQGSINGTVTDSGGAPVNGASVATNPQSSVGSTGANGQYTIPNVGPGSYTVTASAPKFISQSTAGVGVSAGAPTTANFTLAPSPLPATRGGPYWPGWDVARGVALLSNESGGYVLDGFGGLHPFASVGAAPPPVASGSYWRGWNIARGVALLPNGSGGYVLDGYGGLHPFRVSGPGGAMPPPVTTGPYWPGWDIARGVTLLSNGSGYVLDGFGGLHPFRAGGSIPPAVTAGGYWKGWDIARGVVATGAHGGYVVDGLGGTHPWGVGTAPPRPAIGGPYWPRWDIVRGIAGAGSGPGPVRGYVLDGFGGLQPITLWPAP